MNPRPGQPSPKSRQSESEGHTDNLRSQPTPRTPSPAGDPGGAFSCRDHVITTNAAAVLTPNVAQHLADGGYVGAGHGVHVPIKQPGGTQVLDLDNRAYNTLLCGLRAPGERGFALLKMRWRVLQRITACPYKITDIGKAALILTHFEHKYIPC